MGKLPYEPQNRQYMRLKTLINVEKMKKDVIKDLRTDKIYWDIGLIRNFEVVLLENVSFEEAKKEYPDIVKV